MLDGTLHMKFQDQGCETDLACDLVWRVRVSIHCRNSIVCHMPYASNRCSGTEPPLDSFTSLILELLEIEVLTFHVYSHPVICCCTLTHISFFFSA